MPEEIEEYERLSREQEAAMIDGDRSSRPTCPRAARAPLAGGRDVIRPPARVFEVLAKTGRGSQEPFPVFENLAMPPRRCARDAYRSSPRLLPQPGGFEGFNAVKKQCVGQAIAEVQALVELKLNLNDRRRS